MAPCLYAGQSTTDGYQPQVDFWHGHTNLHFRSAIAVKGVLKEKKFGVAEVEALAVTDHGARVVAIVPLRRELRFAGVAEPDLTRLRQAARQLRPMGEVNTLSLDRLVTYLDPAGQPVQRAAEVSLDPPRIFSSTTPAILMIFMGEPRFRPVETNRTDLLFALNTNWDVLYDSASRPYYVLRGEVIQMAAKVTFLDRVLALYGAEAAPLRTQFHAAVKDVIQQMRSDDGSPTAALVHAGDALYVGIQQWPKSIDLQSVLKEQAANLAVELGQLRTLLQAQSPASISRPLLLVVVAWLVIIFFSFSLLAPSNATAATALTVSALSVAGAVFLILEMDRPFTGLIRISSEPLARALTRAETGGP
jgi:hypothetical protein